MEERIKETYTKEKTLTELIQEWIDENKSELNNINVDE